MTDLGSPQRGKQRRHFRMSLRLGPVLGNTLPPGPETLFISVGVLNDQRLQPIRMSEDQAIADGRTVILHIYAVATDLELFEQLVGRLSQMIEGVVVDRGRRGVALTEARIVGSDQV